MLISSLIVLLYFPIYLSKERFFCNNIRNKGTILFYSIDFIFIIDLLINFYRSYYDYNEILIKKTIFIIIHYLKTWFLLDFTTAIPFFTIIKQFEINCIDGNIYSDFKLNNNGKHSNHYNINLNNIHYLLTFLKVIKTIK